MLYIFCIRRFLSVWLNQVIPGPQMSGPQRLRHNFGFYLYNIFFAFLKSHFLKMVKSADGLSIFAYGVVLVVDNMIRYQRSWWFWMKLISIPTPSIEFTFFCESSEDFAGPSLSLSVDKGDWQIFSKYLTIFSKIFSEW